MLKSTHQSSQLPLPSGWTEHKAPTGHSYYYNAATKQSTYTRPTAAPQPQFPGSSPSNFGPIPVQNFAGQNAFSTSYSLVGYPPNGPFGGFQGNQFGPQGSFRGGRGGRGASRGSFGQNRGSRSRLEDRPKSKHLIPTCEPWLLVKTKLGRRFVYHPGKNESFWKIPEELRKGIEIFDRAEKEKVERNKRGEDDSDDDELRGSNEPASSEQDQGYLKRTHSALEEEEEGSTEYEEEGQSDHDEESSFKRQRTDDPNQPTEFNEDDIAWQLAAMGGGGYEYDENPGQWEEDAEHQQLTEEDSKALFKDMLDDYHVSPYSIWDKVIEDCNIVEDERYTILPNMKSRREVWEDWCREKIQKIKEEKAKAEKQDPRLPYLSFLQSHATPKLYWPEFKRKYKKDREMRDAKVTDKDREKWYRDYIARQKLPLSMQTHDLNTLLKSLPLAQLNRSTSMSLLPTSLLTDIRYVALTPSTRDPLIEAYISTLPPAPAASEAEDDAAGLQQKEEREKRERALRERERRVLREKRRVEGDIQMGRSRLKEEEQELKRAMRVGKEGLFGQLQASGYAGGAVKGAGEAVKDE